MVQSVHDLLRIGALFQMFEIHPIGEPPEQLVALRGSASRCSARLPRDAWMPLTPAKKAGPRPPNAA